MKLLRLPAVLLALCLTLAACSGTEPEPPATDATSSAPTGAFPATVESAFGPVTIEQQPQRVVALGWGDAETALALGVQPVGASDWLGFGGEGVGPWAAGQYDSPPQIIETLEPSFEAVAALEPDLILDVKSSGDQARYDRLSSIAPTVGIPEGGQSYLTSTDQQVTMIAAALGQPEQGEQLLAEVDAAFAAAREAHPEWEGRTVSAATRTSEGWGAYIDGSERVDFMQDLGFVQNPGVAALPTGSTGFSVQISSEQLDVLDADVIVAFPIFIPATEITDDPLWQAVPAVAEGRDVVIDGDLASAYSLGTTTSLQYALEQMVPLLEEATA